MGFLGLLVLLLTGLFVAGKIFGFITWSWLMVFLPLMIYMALPFAIVALLLGLLFTVLGAALMLAVVAGIGFLAYLTVLTVISKIRSLLTKRAK
jgi:hypothetical protein